MNNNELQLNLSPRDAFLMLNALLGLHAKEGSTDLSELIFVVLKQMPAPFDKLYVEDLTPEGAASKVECPVTKQILREAGDDDRSVSFTVSPACLIEWDDIELDCVSVKEESLAEPWSFFMESVGYDLWENYDDMIKLFVWAHFDMFQDRKLLLVRLDSRGGGCVSSEVSTYALMDCGIAE